MPAEEGCLGVLRSPVAQASGRVSWARVWRRLFSKAPRSFAAACSSPTLWSSVAGQVGGLVALGLGVLGEGASGALLGEQADKLSVLWSLGESCGNHIC